MDRCCLLLLLLVAATLAGCTQAPSVPDGGSAQQVSAATSPSARSRADWAADVDSGCAYGVAMYPNLALGEDADVDTVAMGVRQFHESLSRVPPPDDPAAREETRLLVTQMRALSVQWDDLATSTSVPRARRVAAAADARSVILAVAAVGAPTCEQLAPPA